MKTSIEHLFIIVVISILFSACKDSENIPKVNTLTYVKIDSASVLLRGQTDSKYVDDNYSYGFLLIFADNVESDEDAKNKLTHYQSSQKSIRNLLCTGADVTVYSFRHTVSGLGPNSTIYYCAYATDGANYSIGNVMKLTTSDMEGLITTEKAIISGLSVTVNASINPEAKNFDDYSFGFELSTEKDFSELIPDNDYVNRDKYSDWYSNTYDGLLFGQTYYYRAVMHYWSAFEKYSATVYGETKSFTIVPIDISITTLDARKNGLFGELLTGKMSEISAEYNFDCGFLYSETQITEQSFTDPDVNLAYASILDNSLMDDGSLKCVVPAKPNTLYYYTAFVKFSENVCVLGETKSFTTPPFQFSINEVNRITAHSVNISCVYNNAYIDIEHRYWAAGIYISSTTKLPSDENYEYQYQTTDDYEIINDIKINSTIVELQPNTTYYYRPYVYAPILNYYTYSYYYGETKSFTTSDVVTVDGAVDLGLSVLWATDNLGATIENPIGDYYAWGETEPKNSFYGKDYTPIQQTNISGTQYDAATAKLGNGWRMPTYDEILDLTHNCNVESVTRNSVPGTLLTSSITGYSIFVPTSNYIIENDTVNGYAFTFWSGQKSTEKNKSYYCERWGYDAYISDAPYYYGMPIRPVYDPLWDKKE